MSRTFFNVRNGRLEAYSRTLEAAVTRFGEHMASRKNQSVEPLGPFLDKTGIVIADSSRGTRSFVAAHDIRGWVDENELPVDDHIRWSDDAFSITNELVMDLRRRGHTPSPY